MFIHTALLQWPTETSEEAIYKALKNLVALHRLIPGLQSVFCGKNYNAPFPAHSSLAIADTEQALQDYICHLNALANTIHITITQPLTTKNNSPIRIPS